jgi:hypothetical protein
MPDSSNFEYTKLMFDEAHRLSDMANNVAGFAISSNLLLIFACLKDIAEWLKVRMVAFEIGVGTGGIVYVGAVWFLHCRELGVLRKTETSDILVTVADVSDALFWSRIAGIAAFTAVSMLAIFGASKGKDASSTTRVSK